MTGHRVAHPSTGHRVAHPSTGHRVAHPSTGRRAARAAAPLVAAVVAAVLVVVVLAGPGGRPAGGVVGAWGTGGAAASADPVSAEPTAADPFGTAVPALRGAPTRLRVPAIRVDTGLQRLRLGDDGGLIPPADFDRAGWYADGTAPGDVGPAVIAGHVDSRRGPAVFYRLRDVRPGDTIEVVRGTATVRFTVTGARWYPKDAFDTREVYGPTPDRQLRLVTCGGVFDRSSRSYADNLVVYAVRN